MDLMKACSGSHKLLDDILSCVQDPVIISDLEGSITFASPMVEKILGFKPSELKGKNVSIFFTQEDLNYLYRNLLYLAKKNEIFEGELMLSRKDGTCFFAFMIFRPCMDLAKDKAIIVISIHDIDRLKQLEKDITETNHEDLIKIADGIAHELRNPLTGIGGFVKRLYKSCRSINDHDVYYDYIIKNVKKIESLIKKVEFFAHLPEPSFTKESTRELIENALRPYLQQIKRRNIQLTKTIEDTDLLVDKDLIIRALSIIIQNALDALNDGGKISINSEAIANQHRISVTDNGSGISSEDLQYIFNPFFSTKADGAGIDLAAVKRIMVAHGGSVEVTSKEDKGATFFLLFKLERRRPIRVSRFDN